MSRDRPRLLIVTRTDLETKRELLRSSSQLRSMPEWQHLFINPDLTPAERETNKKLRLELATRRASGKEDLIIKKGKIVKISHPSKEQSMPRPSTQSRVEFPRLGSGTSGLDDSSQPKQNKWLRYGARGTRGGISALYTNADQFVNKRDLLVTEIVGCEPDVIMITEVIPKAQSSPFSSSLFQTDGYKSYFNFDPSSDHLGLSGIRGICIFIKDFLKCVLFRTPPTSAVEALWLNVSLQGSDSLTLGCVYRSPPSCLNASTSEICNMFKFINKNVIIPYSDYREL